MFRRRKPPEILSPDTVSAAVEFEWDELGKMTVSRSGRLQLPRPPAGPGLYRFRVVGTPNPAVYIGETGNFIQRFATYANPGSSQQTNIRLNAEMARHIQDGGETLVDVATKAWLTAGGKRDRLDLDGSAARRFAENAAILIAQHAGDHVLNR